MPTARPATRVGTATSDGLRFRVLRPHARGGLGAVFVALDTELHREVALKQMLDHHADDPVSRQRFLVEAEITGGLEHPGIVPVYGLGTYADGRPFYAMRFIRGDSLKEAIDRFHGDEALKKDPAAARWSCAGCSAAFWMSAMRSSTRTAAACCTAISSRATSSSASTARRRARDRRDRHESYRSALRGGSLSSSSASRRSVCNSTRSAHSGSLFSSLPAWPIHPGLFPGTSRPVGLAHPIVRHRQEQPAPTLAKAGRR